MQQRSPKWMSAVLVAAGFYNLVWGAIVVLFPGLFFDLANLEQPLYPAIWQCVGMIVGVYGVGYLAASSNPTRHWPIVLVGLLGKVLGPIGFVWSALVTDSFPVSFGLVIIPNDLIWWVPFAMILYAAAKAAQLPRDAEYAPALTPEGAMLQGRDQDGVSISEHSMSGPVLLVFLRHLGCTFCREALQDLEKQQDQLRDAGTTLVLVTMSEDREAREALVKYGLEQAPRISDPGLVLYHAFELSRGSFFQLFGPRVWLRGLIATLKGNSVGGLKGDGFQMPGVFLINKGRVVRAHRHKNAGERPAYGSIAGACPVPSDPKVMNRA